MIRLFFHFPEDPDTGEIHQDMWVYETAKPIDYIRLDRNGNVIERGVGYASFGVVEDDRGNAWVHHFLCVRSSLKGEWPGHNEINRNKDKVKRAKEAEGKAKCNNYGNNGNGDGDGHGGSSGSGVRGNNGSGSVWTKF